MRSVDSIGTEAGAGIVGSPPDLAIRSSNRD